MGVFWTGPSSTLSFFLQFFHHIYSTHTTYNVHGRKYKYKIRRGNGPKIEEHAVAGVGVEGGQPPPRRCQGELFPYRRRCLDSPPRRAGVVDDERPGQRPLDPSTPLAAAAVESTAGRRRRARSVRRQIHHHLGSDREKRITSAAPGLEIQPVQRADGELRRPPPPEKNAPAPKPPARSNTSSRAPPASLPTYPPVFTCRSRGSPPSRRRSGRRRGGIPRLAARTVDRRACSKNRLSPLAPKIVFYTLSLLCSARGRLCVVALAYALLVFLLVLDAVAGDKLLARVFCLAN